MKRAICIWLPDWPLERMYAARPELRPLPLALYQQQPRGGLVVVAVSRLAAERKIRPGMSVAEAASIAAQRRAAPLRLLPCDPATDRAALVQLADECEMFAPIVGLEDAAWPQCLLLDVSGLGRLFGGEAALLEQVVEHFANQSIPMRAALADTIGAAWAVAHFADPASAQSCGGWLVPPGESAAALALLPLESLRLSEPLLAWLRELGLTTLDQLQLLERDAIAARFGPELLLRWDQALGHMAEVIRPCRVQTPERAERLLEPPIANTKAIARVVDELLAKLIATLSSGRRGIARLACRLEGESKQAVNFTLSLVRPTLSRRHLLELLELKLERIKLDEPVASISLQVLASAPLGSHQQELFETENSAGDRRAVGQLVDRLASRLGPAAVVQPRAWPDAQPEHAWRGEPIAGERQPAAAAAPRRRAPRAPLNRWPTLRAGQRPLRLAREPIPVQLVSIVPDGPPISLRLAGRDERIVHRWGPERIETGWWRGRSARRDYYRVQLASGRQLWLFRRLADGAWFLQGWF